MPEADFDRKSIFALCQAMQHKLTTLGSLAESVFAGKAVSRLKPGTDSVAVVSMRDVDLQLAPRANLELHSGINSVEISHLHLLEGDIVLTSRGTVRGAVATADHAGAIPGANIAVIRLWPPTPPKVIVAYLRHPQIAATLMGEFAGSATAGFSVEGLKRLPIALPNPLMLKQMDKMIDAADRYRASVLEAAHARSSLALELVAQNLLPKAEYDE